MWQEYFQPASLPEALELLASQAGRARIVAGGTDVLVELQRGVRPTDILIDITRIAELKYVRDEGDWIALGALATHNDVVASEACVRRALPLAQACWEVGAPQIRAQATVAGNLVTASPANDTIPPLLALDAELVLASAGGERVVPLREFYTGVRRTVLRPDELLRAVRFRALPPEQRGLFLKLGLRRAQAISVINLAVVLTFEGPTIAAARIALGSLAPTVVRAGAAEAFLAGKTLDSQVCAEAGRLARGDVSPIDDLRGSAGYRLKTLEALVADGLRRIAEGREREGWPERPVLLQADGHRPAADDRRPVDPPTVDAPQPVVATINGSRYELARAHAKTLLDALREDAGLTGTKEGCAEGECGACTVWLDGRAVMACLMPAPQAHGAEVVTIEGLSGVTSGASRGTGESVPGVAALHPLQSAFIRNGAVQCGFCIPGMLMAGARLLDEHPRPTHEQIQTALSGNICRCTGYRKIVDAVHEAAGESAGDRRQGANIES